jgi:hypothetical protein
MVAQEAVPGWGGDLGPPRHVSADGGLAHHDTELEQFAMNARRTPEGVAMLIRRIRSRVSVHILGRPGWPEGDRHRQ